MKKGWQATKLGDVLRLEYGKPLSDDKRKPDGKYPVYGANGEKGRSDEFYCSKPTIIVGRKGSAGEINFTEEKFWPLDVTYFVEFDERRFDLRFIYNMLERLNLPALAKGVKPGINRNEVYAIDVQVPPLPEQQRIVSILDEALEDIATASANDERNLSNAREVLETYLHKIFKRTDLNWKSARLSDICSSITVGHVGSMASKYIASGIPFLRSQNIRPFEVTMDNVVFIDSDFHKELRKSQLRAGDVAIVRTGYPGVAAVIPEGLDQVNCSDLVIVRPLQLVNPQYLAAFFNSSYGKQLVNGKLVGAAQKHFNVTAAKEVHLSLPPIEQQDSTVASIFELRSEVQKLESVYQQKLSALSELKKSILHQAFTGQLH